MPSYLDNRHRKKAVEDDAGEEPLSDVTLDMLDDLAGVSTKGARTTRTAEPEVIEREIYIPVSTPAIEQLDKGMRIGNFLVTSTGLEIADDTTQEEWADFYKAVSSIRSSLNWVYGDYFAYGQSHFGMTYDQMADATGLKSETIETYASVCRNIPKLIRINSLSFGHHRLVAGYDEQAQAQWLETAVENKWSVLQMRRAIEGLSLPVLPALADRKNRRILNRVWKAVQNDGAGLKVEDIRHLRRWLDEVERMKR